jgi:hypothetical protein
MRTPKAAYEIKDERARGASSARVSFYTRDMMIGKGFEAEQESDHHRGRKTGLLSHPCTQQVRVRRQRVWELSREMIVRGEWCYKARC